MEHARAGVLGELVPGQIAGRHSGVIALIDDAEAPELMLQGRTWPRRVGKEHDDAALLAEASRRIDRGGERPHAVIHHRPTVDEPGGQDPTKRPDTLA